MDELLDRIMRMYDLYQEGYSLRQVASVFSTTSSNVQKHFKNNGLATRRKNLLPYIEFNGEKYTLGTGGYYCRTTNKNTSVYLHREVWMYHRGPIPNTHSIHHKDRDKSNNDISNLECMIRGDHTRLHNKPPTPVDIKPCMICGKSIQPNKHEYALAYRKRKCCSLECAGRYRTLMLSFKRMHGI